MSYLSSGNRFYMNGLHQRNRVLKKVLEAIEEDFNKVIDDLIVLTMRVRELEKKDE